METAKMRHSIESHWKTCGCRSVDECTHNITTEMEALGALVDDFAMVMKKKMYQSMMQGNRGWDQPEWTTKQIQEGLREHLAKGDPVDVANFAAFWWNRQAPAPAAAERRG